MDPEVVEILAMRENIKTIQGEEDEKLNDTKNELKDEDASSVSDMYSDIEDDNLDTLKAKYAKSDDKKTQKEDEIADKTKTISDLINAIETKRYESLLPILTFL